MSNINFYIKAIDTDILWETVQWEKGYKLERNNITGHSRILNKEGIRVASGSHEKMSALIDRLIKPWPGCKKGDILAVPRYGGLYSHFAVYAGYGKVIHLSVENQDGKDIYSIHKADFSEFLLSDTKYEILHFPENGLDPVYERVDLTKDGKHIAYMITDFAPKLKAAARNHKGYHIYSAQETLDRAQSKIGKCEYNLTANNCEHFALWCKTGLKESSQVEDFWKRLLIGKNRFVETDLKYFKQYAMA